MRVLVVALAAAGVPLGTAPLVAQSVNGHVVDSLSAQPVVGAFATLLDSAGSEVARTLTGQDGAFLLRAPAPGLFRIQTKRIGFRAIITDTVRLAAGQTLRYRLVTGSLPIALPTVIVKGKPRCGDYGEAGSVSAQLWSEAREALRAVAWTTRQPRWEYRLSLYDRDLDPSGRKVLEERTREETGYYRSPFASASPEELGREGYVVGDDPGHRVFRAPDAEVLLSTTFMEGHCFGVTTAKHDPGLVGLQFRPASEGDRADVSGVLWLDRRNAALSSLDFTYEHVSSELPKGNLGGHVAFMQLPSGPWIVGEWWIKTARLGVVRWPNGRREWRLQGYLQTGGRVVQLTSPEGAVAYDAKRAVLRGLVYDSTRSRPLAGATVTLIGTRYSTTADRRGGFDLAVATEGEYQVSFSHPHLDSLGFTPQPVAVTLAPGREVDVRLAVPSEATIGARLCSDSAAVPEGRALTGTVTPSTGGRPVPGAEVIVAWQDSARRGSMGSGERRLRVTTGSAGTYVACGIPMGTWVAVLAAKTGHRAAATFRFGQSGVWDGPERFTSFAGGIWTEDLALTADSGTALRGVVIDSVSRKPLAGVVVRALGVDTAVVTGSDGGFTLRDLPAGEVALTLHRIGSGARAVALTLGPDKITNAGALALAPLPVTLAEATVVGHPTDESRMLDLVGFAARRKMGFGDYITRQEFEKYTPITVHDVLRRVPGLDVRPNPNYGKPLGDGQMDFRRYLIEFRRTGGAAGRMPGSPACPVQFYLNGGYLGNDNNVQIDDIVAENQIEAIEAYVGLDVPQQFSSVGAECGVVVFWTRR